MGLKYLNRNISSGLNAYPGRTLSVLGILFLGVAVSSVRAESHSVLIKNFQLEQAKELKVLDQSQKAELKELEASQNARRKEWETQEQKARHAFFAASPPRKEKRDYVHQYLERRTALNKMLKAENQDRRHALEVRRKAVKEDQIDRLREFTESLKMSASSVSSSSASP